MLFRSFLDSIKKGGFGRKHPVETLKLLNAAMPNSEKFYVNDIRAILNQIGEANPSLINSSSYRSINYQIVLLEQT